MELKCMPGDVAMVTRATGETGRQFLGQCMTVTRTFQNTTGRTYWEYEGERRYAKFGDMKIPVGGFADGVLMPIRPGPGEDEMLRLVGAPKHTPADFLRDMTMLMLALEQLARVVARLDE